MSVIINPISRHSLRNADFRANIMSDGSFPVNQITFS